MRTDKKYKFIFLAIFALGLFARLWRFGELPCGLNQDEAFAAYESWALLHYGVDSSLHPWPVYLTAWGSGMNALESYLMLPFLALFGVKVWVLRLPQLLVALASIYAAWRLGRRIGDERTGLCLALALALCPWHILLSRWGLESNLAPGFLLFGLCLFLRGLEDGRFLPLSALCCGLALYAYSAIWPVLPLLLGLSLLAARPKADRRLLFAGLILAALALPLLGFLAVNYGWIGEFSIGPFSVPRLVELRADAISTKQISQNAEYLFDMLLSGGDGLVWNSPPRFGLFYPFGLPLSLIGLGTLLVRLVRSVRERRFDPAVLLLIQLLSGLVLGLLIAVNANRANLLLLSLVLCAGLGLDTLSRLPRAWGRAAAGLLCAVWLVFFGLFARFLFCEYNDLLRGEFTWGVEEALDEALSHEGTVYITKAVHYPKVLLLAEIPPRDFAESVEYERYPARYLSARSFLRYRFYEDKDMPLDPEGVYVLWTGTPTEIYERFGFTVERIGVFQVLWREDA